MKKQILLMLLALFMSTAPALAEYEYAGQIHESLPEMKICVSDTGETDVAQEHLYLLRVSVEAQDGMLAQEMTYRASVSAAHEGAAPLVRLRDVNFDGYDDLLLLTAQGARNVFYAVSVFHPQENRFMPVMQTFPWNTEKKAFDTQRLIQLELCNEELFPEKRMVCSSVADGYRYQTEITYMWEGSYSLVPVSVADIYDAGENRIGELLEKHATGVRRCWDEQYPEAWYYGQDGIAEERRTSLRALTVGGADTDPEFMAVAHVSWVNLRKQDSKASPSLAKLNAGTEVQVLAEGCGTDGGWIRVFVWPDDGETGMTGYIWHSYLEPAGP